MPAVVNSDVYSPPLLCQAQTKTLSIGDHCFVHRSCERFLTQAQRGFNFVQVLSASKDLGQHSDSVHLTPPLPPQSLAFVPVPTLGAADHQGKQDSRDELPGETGREKH